MTESERSRREFVGDVGKLATAVALAGCATPLHAAASQSSPATAGQGAGPMPQARRASSDWDLSWVDRVTSATDRAVFDWPSLGSQSDSIMMQLAERFLDNCAAAYGANNYKAQAVMNIRTTSISAAMTDDAWSRFSLGTEYKVKDPATNEDAVRNPFWKRAGERPSGPASPVLSELVQRGAIILVCDFAMGHLSNRLATRMGRSADEVHAELRRSLVPNSYAVPSGIFGLAKAQNSGCALVHV